MIRSTETVTVEDEHGCRFEARIHVVWMKHVKGFGVPALIEDMQFDYVCEVRDDGCKQEIMLNDALMAMFESKLEEIL